MRPQPKTFMVPDDVLPITLEYLLDWGAIHDERGHLIEMVGGKRLVAKDKGSRILTLYGAELKLLAREAGFKELKNVHRMTRAVA